MNVASHAPRWTKILQNIIKLPAEKKRLANALGMAEMTLTRWANGDSNPQRPHLLRLLQVLQAKHREELLSALEEQYPDVQSWFQDENDDQVPSWFFAQVLNARTTTTESLLFWRISELVLKQALAQLDPNNLGMAIKLIQCMPPSNDGKIRSIRERAGRGTSPWTADLEHDVLFLGLESLSGYATESRHAVYSRDLRKRGTVPAYPAEFEISAAAYPVRMEGRIAGCLLASSIQEDYFSQERLALLGAFSDLIALAFNKEDFYPPDLIELRFMPRISVQRPIIATFRDRVTKKFQESMQQHSRLSNQAMELLVWQEIEQELMNLPPDAFDVYQ